MRCAMRKEEGKNRLVGCNLKSNRDRLGGNPCPAKFNDSDLDFLSIPTELGEGYDVDGLAIPGT